MYDTWIDRHFGKIMLSFLGTIILLVCVGLSYQADLALRHYKQCLDDGKKEYECYAIVYNGGRR